MCIQCDSPSVPHFLSPAQGLRQSRAHDLGGWPSGLAIWTDDLSRATHVTQRFIKAETKAITYGVVYNIGAFFTEALLSSLAYYSQIHDTRTVPP